VEEPSIYAANGNRFGYTGYKDARFGKIEAHEAANAAARETLLVAKEIAEARGFKLLHALVDSLYVTREDAERVDYESLAEEIEQRTKLPIAIEAIYRYVVFMPSRQNVIACVQVVNVLLKSPNVIGYDLHIGSCFGGWAEPNRVRHNNIWHFGTA
jgi:hypothetical protein